MTSGDWLPAQAPFDLVRRGFAPEQVTAHLERLEYDLRITTANRDATNQRLAELGAQLAAAQAEADALRAQLDRSALEPVSMANLSDRMQRMIRLAEEEASEIRARAEADADRLRAQLETSLADAAENRAAFDAERERTRKQLAEQVHGLIAEAAAEAEETKSAAQDEAVRTLQQANDEAERTVTEARAQAAHLVEVAHSTAEQELAAAREEAQRVTTEATTAADELTRSTAAERERLDAESLARRTQIDEDFEIAITAKRLEANRIITERDEGSAAAAETLVADARAHAEQLVTTASAEADNLMRQATTYANALVNRATAESHQRVADADAAVTALETLRSQLTDQLRSLTGHLDHIRELAASAPALLVPPADELGRPVSADFPLDPAARPTSTELPVPVYGQEEAGSPAAEDVEADAGTAEAGTTEMATAGAFEASENDIADDGTRNAAGANEADPVQLPDQLDSDTSSDPDAADQAHRELNGVGASADRSRVQRRPSQARR